MDEHNPSSGDQHKPIFFSQLADIEELPRSLPRVRRTPKQADNSGAGDKTDDELKLSGFDSAVRFNLFDDTAVAEDGPVMTPAPTPDASILSGAASSQRRASTYMSRLWTELRAVRIGRLLSITAVLVLLSAAAVAAKAITTHRATNNYRSSLSQAQANADWARLTAEWQCTLRQYQTQQNNQAISQKEVQPCVK